MSEENSAQMWTVVELMGLNRTGGLVKTATIHRRVLRMTTPETTDFMPEKTNRLATMKTWTNPKIDKTPWGYGAWVGEPDKAQWVDETSGLDCLIVRGPMGALCGYVGVPDSHPSFEREDVNASCHGGLTFSGPCQGHEGDPFGICHIPEDGRTDKIWWLGFDCSHYGDFTPRYPSDGIYRNLAYVQKECADLAGQLELITA